MKTDSPQLGDLLKQPVDASPDLGEPRGMPGPDASVWRLVGLVIVLSAHGS